MWSLDEINDYVFCGNIGVINAIVTKYFPPMSCPSNIAKFRCLDIRDATILAIYYHLIVTTHMASKYLPKYEELEDHVDKSHFLAFGKGKYSWIQVDVASLRFDITNALYNRERLFQDPKPPTIGG